MGLAPGPLLGSSVAALLLTCVLYLGPLTLDCLEERGRGASSSWWAGVRGLAGDLRAWRNYVVGPVTEELVFRAAVVPLWVAAGIAQPAVLLVSPLVFAVAHIHHAVFVEAQWTRLVLAGMLMQVAYTAVFGCYAAALFLRTGCVAAPTVAHVVCNVMGLPSTARIAAHPKKYLMWAVHGAACY
ncbi:hypothetical protein GGI21_006645 [Coemansia aciculifera]|nr:hypothetical protein GGI21_006645 [Coemansia aciculifera]